MALRILWGTVSPLQHYFRHTLSRTMLLSSEKRQQKENQESLISAQPKSQTQGWEERRSQKGQTETPLTPKTRVGDSQNAVVPPMDGGAQLLLSPAQGPLYLPQAPQRICLGTMPTPPGQRDAEWAVWDRNHHIKVKGSK